MSLVIRKRGRFWYARGTVPSRQSSGEIINVRIERSLKTVNRNDALKRAADLDRYYWNLAHGKVEKSGPSFTEAATTYIRTRGKSDRFVTALIGYFKDTSITEIDQAKATKAAAKLYPGWKQSSLNRAIYVPLSAIGIQGLTRFAEEKAVLCIPPDDWFEKFARGKMPANLLALILFITITGRREGEAVRLAAKAVDAQGYAIIGKTKNGEPIFVKVPEICLQLLGAAKPHERLFGYYSLQGAYSTLYAVCDRLGLPRYRFHAIGRHSFASRALKANKSLKWIKEAGGWASMQSVMRYLHLEVTEVQREAQEMGEQWGKQFTPKGNSS